MYDNLCVVGFAGLDEDTVMNALIENDIDFVDMENNDGNILIYGNPNDIFKIKEAITSVKNDIEFTIEEISQLPKERITLAGEDLETFEKLINLLDEVDDVSNVYHNVENV